METASLCAQSLSFVYGARRILQDVNLELKPGSLTFVLGPNGCGKTTLMRLLLGTLAPEEGTVLLDGREIGSWSRKEIAQKLAYVPQSNHPIFAFTALQMVQMGRMAQLSLFASPSAQDEEAALEALDRLGIADLADRSIAAMSGGERQLVLLARALVQDARILLLDEPTSNLDYGNQIRVLEQVRKLADSGYSILLSSHQPQQALDFADQVLILQNHQLTATGTPDQLLTPDCIHQLYGVHALRIEVEGRTVLLPERPK